jgi:hypothetical protein
MEPSAGTRVGFGVAATPRVKLSEFRGEPLVVRASLCALLARFAFARAG